MSDDAPARKGTEQSATGDYQHTRCGGYGGVSERTIYRMLRSGRLIRSDRRVGNVKNVSDNTVSNDINQREYFVKVLSKMSDISDRATAASLETLLHSLQEKDAQIEQL